MDKFKEKDRILSCMGTIDEGASKDIFKAIAEINANDNDYFKECVANNEWFKTYSTKNKIYREEVIPNIRLLLSTYGGSVYDGLGIYDAIKTSTTPIDVDCSGKIMSMGIIIMLGSKVRKAHKHTTFMIHQVSSIAAGKTKDMEEDVEETKRLNNILFDLIAANTTISRDKLQEIYDHKKDWFLTADQVLSYGLITEII